MTDRLKDSTKHVYWNNSERCYVALISEVPTCSATGSTVSEALHNVDEAYNAMKRSYSVLKPVAASPMPLPLLLRDREVASVWAAA